MYNQYRHGDEVTIRVTADNHYRYPFIKASPIFSGRIVSRIDSNIYQIHTKEYGVVKIDTADIIKQDKTTYFKDDTWYEWVGKVNEHGDRQAYIVNQLIDSGNEGHRLDFARYILNGNFINERVAVYSTNIRSDFREAPDGLLERYLPRYVFMSFMEKKHLRTLRTSTLNYDDLIQVKLHQNPFMRKASQVELEHDEYIRAKQKAEKEQHEVYIQKIGRIKRDNDDSEFASVSIPKEIKVITLTEY